MTQKESSIVWFIKQFNAYGTENFKTLFKKEIEQAKEMHKQEIMDAYKFGISDEYVIGSKKYYNETFAQIGGHSEIPNTHQKNINKMKLYTEEQLHNTVKSIQDYLDHYDEKEAQEKIEKHLKALTPIELPSDSFMVENIGAKQE